MLTLTFDERKTAVRQLRAANAGWPEDFAAGFLDGMIDGAEGTLDYCAFHNKYGNELFCCGYRSAWTYWNNRLKARQTFSRIRNPYDPSLPTEVCERCNRTVFRFVNVDHGPIVIAVNAHILFIAVADE